MSGVGFLDDTVTLFIPVLDGGFEVRLLSGVMFSASLGISGGDAAPMRRGILYFFDARSRCTGKEGRICGYLPPDEWESRVACRCLTLDEDLPPDEWESLQNREEFFTFDASGGCFVCEGDARGFTAPPDSAYRITSVERPSGGRRLLRHFKVTLQ